MLTGEYHVSPKEDNIIMKSKDASRKMINFIFPQLTTCSRAILKDIRHNSASRQMRMLAHKRLMDYTNQK
jgi:hypothetical protein